MASAFVVTMLIAPFALRAIAGPSSKWSGSIGVGIILMPITAGVLWVVFSLIAIVKLTNRDASGVSVAGCIGIALILAIVGTFVTLALYHIPAYGPGP